MNTITDLPFWQDVLERVITCYNTRDIHGFMECFSDDVTVTTCTFNDPISMVIGRQDVQAVYQELFDLSPNLHATILNRIVFDSKIIDQESISGRRSSEENYKVVVIYELSATKITRMTAIRK